MMTSTNEDLIRRLQVAQESLDTELKPWLQPSTDVGKSVIAKACLSLRNANGGFLIIGVADDGTGINDNIPEDIRTVYHVDVIQQIISKYASEPFEIRVHYVPKDGFQRVMIEIPAGVKTPVICKNDLPQRDSEQGKRASLLRLNDVYVRTVSSNGRVSSSVAMAQDWPRIMENCFNNREADVGAFVRRQLSSVNASAIVDALLQASTHAKTTPPSEALNEVMDAMFSRFLTIKQKEAPTAPATGTREFAAMIIGDFERPSLSEEYMTRFVKIPRYSGWPPFIELTNIYQTLGNRRYVHNGWESLEYSTEAFHTLDFSRMEAAGRFYYLEALRDDMSTNIKPREHFEFVLETSRVAEIIAICLAFGKEFCGNETPHELQIAFRWRGLNGRRISTWAHPERRFNSRGLAQQDEIAVPTTIPIETAINAIGPFVEKIMSQVFLLFGGWKFESTVIQNIVAERLKTRT